MSDLYTVIYSSQALEDLKDIYSCIAFELQVPDTAKNQVNRILKGISSLDFMPARFSNVDWEPWKSMKMHKLFIDNFAVFYLIDSASLTVKIIRMLYGKRDTKSMMENSET